MDIFTFLSGFLYRIRYKLIIGTTIAVLMAVYFTSFLPKLYDVKTTIFTGITSKASVNDMSGRTDWNAANNAHDNIINIIKSKSTLESVSISLLAQHLMYGDANKDNKYIKSVNYKKLIAMVPGEVKALVDHTSYDKTVANLHNYKREGQGNFIYDLFNWNNKYYGYMALSTIKALRKGASDMIEVSYQCDDPGIASNTLSLLNFETAKRYEMLLLSPSKDVVKYFEEQLILAKSKLESAEDDLVGFNIDNNIINYEEQTKHLAALNNNFESRYEEILLTNSSSAALVRELEQQMNTKTKLVLENDDFLKALNQVSKLNGTIAEIEIFGSDETNKEELAKRKKELVESEDRIKEITKRMNGYRFSKEGLAINAMVDQWLDALLKYEKSTAELVVMKKRKQEINDQYAVFSPVGPNLGRMDREVRVDEQYYLTILNHLGQAKLKQKNILLESGTLQIVTEPEIPLLVKPRKREIFVVAAMVGAILIIAGFFLIIEILDRTVRDGFRAQRLTGGKVIGAYPSGKGTRHRRFAEEAEQMATSTLANALNEYIAPGIPMIVNVLSVEKGEGKSFIMERMSQYWSDRGFKVVELLYDLDFEHDSKRFLSQNSLFDAPEMAKKAEGADIILVEYADLRLASVPVALLKEASINLLILNAQRVWSPRDQIIFDSIKNMIGIENSLKIFLTMASRESVEMYTGQLPPYTLLRKLSYRFFNLGITARS